MHTTFPGFFTEAIVANPRRSSIVRGQLSQQHAFVCSVEAPCLAGSTFKVGRKVGREISMFNVASHTTIWTSSIQTSKPHEYIYPPIAMSTTSTTTTRLQIAQILADLSDL